MSDAKTCPKCNGAGMQIRDNGEPGLCTECHGDCVVKYIQPPNPTANLPMRDTPEDRIFLLRSDALMAGRKTNVGGLEPPAVGEDSVTYVREDLHTALTAENKRLNMTLDLMITALRGHRVENLLEEVDEIRVDLKEILERSNKVTFSP